MASSAFSFHCMICFEEFDPVTNYPVVLPCGHTYVCIECANRLDKCMECRTPLTMKIDLPPAAMAATPATPGSRGAASAGATGAAGGGAAAIGGSDSQKENQRQQSNNYADRVRNSPGFRRRYGGGGVGGGGDPYYNSNQNVKRMVHPHLQPQAHPPPQPPQRQRLPLPKNAVLLSLIQASEPARRRAEVEAPPTPQKSEEDGSGNPGEGGRRRGGGPGHSTPPDAVTPPGPSLPKYSRPSPLFLDGSSSGEHDNGGGGGGALHLGGGSTGDDEEHKIRVGTYLEGGPCGTYAVAVREGLLVYPTLFEHALPSGLKKLSKGDGGRKNGAKGGTGVQQEQEEDNVKRDVEELVKRHRAKSIKLGGGGEADNYGNNNNANVNVTPEAKSQKKLIEEAIASVDAGGDVSPVDTELGVSHTWVECSHEDENVEARCSMPTPRGSPGRESTPAMGGEDSMLVPALEDDRGGNNYGVLPGAAASSGPGAGADVSASSPALEASSASDRGGGEADLSKEESEPGGAAIDLSGEDDDDDDVGPSVSLTISDDEEDLIGASCRTLPARRSQSHMDTLHRVGSAEEQAVPPDKKKLVRHFSMGSRLPKLAMKKRKNGGKGSANKEDDGSADEMDEFDRPLVRLKYGDRVQVVSMDSRGWVKLARGYGYIRLENDKQLVKVGGTSDKACQIEAMLHELSIERNRLKSEQTKLECLSAGLMIDLQSTLLASDDHVIVPAPEGSLRQSESELSLSMRGEGSVTSVDDIDISIHSRSVLTPPRMNEHRENNEQHRQIRTAKSHSPGRSAGMGAKPPKAPPSPPYGQVTPSNPPSNWVSVNTPTRVNFRTGLSGHRALSSAHAHPHDFIDRGAPGGRSMSNHMGISSSKKPSSRGRSIY